MSDIEEQFKITSTHPIEKLYAYIVKDEDGSESVMCVFGNNGAFPLIGSDMKRMESLRGLAETISERYGKQVRLVEFSKRKNITLGHMKTLPNERGQWEA